MDTCMHLKQASSEPTFLDLHSRSPAPLSSISHHLHLSSRVRPSFVSSYLEANLSSELKSAHPPSDRACARRHHSCRRSPASSHLSSTTSSCARERLCPTMARRRAPLLRTTLACVALAATASAQTYYFTGAVTVQQGGGGYTPAQQAVCPAGYENRCDAIGASD